MAIAVDLGRKATKQTNKQNHALFVIFEKAAKFEIVACFKLHVAFYGLKNHNRRKSTVLKCFDYTHTHLPLLRAWCIGLAQKKEKKKEQCFNLEQPGAKLTSNLNLEALILPEKHVSPSKTTNYFQVKQYIYEYTLKGFFRHIKTSETQLICLTDHSATGR